MLTGHRAPDPPAGVLCVHTVSTVGVDQLGFLLDVITDDDNAQVEAYGYWSYRAP